MSSTVNVRLNVNGTEHELDVEPRLLLVHALRDRLGLTGTHVGCDTSQCGACTILFNGTAVKSCTILAVQADGAELKTIEGYAEPNGKLHPIQQAFWEEHGLQCGFCTPGMVTTLACQLDKKSSPATLDEIKRAVAGNFCRCGTYTRIFEAAGCGACLITDTWEGIDRFLEPGREILIASDGAEVAAHLESLTPGKANEIAARARRRILAHHTYRQRALQFNRALEGQQTRTEAAE